MSNLAVEYFRRHGSNVVLPTNDGVVFFNDLICLTSVSPKTVNCCSYCGKDYRIVVEFIATTRDKAVNVIFHGHVEPDTDLVKCMKNFYSDSKPVYLKNNTEIEVWLWNYYLLKSKLHLSKTWKEFAQTLTTKEPFRTNQMLTWCALNLTRVFQSYYSLYQTVVVGRKYLLYG